MRETRVIAHQATAGAQTPWQETNPSEPPFTFPLNADPAQVQAAVATLPNSTTPIGSLDPESAYWAAVWRNDIPDYQAYLAAFAATAPPERKAVIAESAATAAAAQSAMPGERCAASAADDHRRAGLPRRVLRPGRFRRGLLRAARPAAGVGLPARLRVDPHRRRHGLRALPSAASACLPAAIPSDRPALLRARHPAALLPAGLPPRLARRPDGVRAQWPAAADLPLRDSSGVERRRYVCGGNPPPPIPCPNGQPNWRNGQWSCLPPPPSSCPGDERPQWINGKLICGVFRPPVGPTPCPFGFMPSHKAAAPAASRRTSPCRRRPWRRRSSGRRRRLRR